MQLQSHRLSIWTSLLNANALQWALDTPQAGAPLIARNESISASENESLWFTWYLYDEDTVNLSIVDMWGKAVCNLYAHKHMKDGSHEYVLNLAEHPLAPGAYAYKLDTREGSVYKRIVIY
jgi:hypothetical protein